MNKSNNTSQSKAATISTNAKAQFLMTAYQGLMLAIILSVLIGHGEAL